MEQDNALESLLELDETKYVIDEKLGLWVKFTVKKTPFSLARPHGIKYSLTLHNRQNKRLMGFDNAHPIDDGGKNKVSPKKIYDHWHRDVNDNGRPYNYKNAGKLIVDFWKEVEKIMKSSEEDSV